MPLYPLFESVDNVQWSADTVWHGEQRGAYSPAGARLGDVLIVDDVDLPEIGDGTYDAVIQSHVIEHLANPLRALAAWRRVLRHGGELVMVVPHKEGTFDHRRPLTTLEHLVDDLAAGTGEDDLTHLDETLRLHDRSRDAETGTAEEWAQRRRDNLTTRLIHHHVFTAPSVLSMLRWAGFGVIGLEVRFPHDIYVRAISGEDGRPDADFDAALRASPFRSDRA